MQTPLRSLSVFIAFFASILCLSANPLLLELKKDKIDIQTILNSPKANPLQNALRPKNSAHAPFYEFHGLSEKQVEGIYPIYKWEAAGGEEGVKHYELVKTWEGSLPQLEKTLQLSEDEAALLEFNIDSASITGLLTKSTLTASSPSEKFLIIGTTNLVPLSFKRNSPSEVTTETKKEEAAVEKKTPAEAPVKKEEVPYGIPVPGHKDLVYFPQADGKFNKEQPIDVSGLERDTLVRDPYTGKVFRVP